MLYDTIPNYAAILKSKRNKFDPRSSKGEKLVEKLLSDIEQPSLDITHLDVRRNPELLKILITSPRVDINALSPEGNTALMHATLDGNIELMRLLIASGSDVNLTTPTNGLRTVLMYAAMHPKSENMEPLLKTPCINVNAVDLQKNTALMLACIKKMRGGVEALLRVPDIDINAVNSAGDTALTITAKEKNIGILNMLLANPKLNIPAQLPPELHPTIVEIIETVRKKRKIYMSSTTPTLFISKQIPPDVGRLIGSHLSFHESLGMAKVHKDVHTKTKAALTEFRINEIFEHKLKPDVAALLKNAMNDPNITKLDLSKQELYTHDALAIAYLLPFTRITELDVSFNRIDPEGIRALAAIKTIRSLDVTENNPLSTTPYNTRK